MAANGAGAGPASKPTVGEQEYLANLGQLGFYKHYFGKLLWALIIITLVACCLAAGMVYLAQQAVHGKREYFAVDPETGRLTPMIPLNEPYISDGALLGWFRDCVVQANTYNFVEYREQFTRAAQACFTDDGWSGYAEALSRSGAVKLVREGRLIASGNSTGAPVITRKGERGGKHTWMIEMPLAVTYQGGQSGRNVNTQRLIVTAVVERVPTYQRKNGVGIAQYVAKEE